MENIFSQLVNHFGGQTATASELEVNQSTVSNWVRGKHGMSPVVALRAERVTGGKFKAAKLCPEVFGVVAA